MMSRLIAFKLTGIPKIAAVLLVFAVSSGCTNGTKQPDGSKVVNVYSARHYNTDDALYDGFTQKTGIEINIIEGKDSELLERIKSEGDLSPADIFLTVDAGRIGQAETDGLFQPVKSKALEAAVPESLRHPQGLWFGLSKRARIFVYNPNTVKPEQLSTYENLASPEWKGRVCVRSSNNIYNQSLVAWMIEKDGAEKTETWAKGLVGNFVQDPEGGDVPQIRLVAEGKCDVAIANHYYLARLLKSKEPKDQAVIANVKPFFPQMTHVNISAAGVLAKAPHAANAIQFLEYLASPEAQSFFAEGNNEYPVSEGTKLDPVLQEFGAFEASPVNVSSYGKNNAQAIEIMDRAGWK